MAQIEDREFRANWLINKIFRYAFVSWLVNRFFYNMQGHATYKRKYRGREEKVYFATPGRINILRLMALVKVCKAV